MASPSEPVLDLDDIQGDVVIGLQKQAERFIFFKILDAGRCKGLLKTQIVSRLTDARTAAERDRLVERYRRLQQSPTETWAGANLGFTNTGLNQLLGSRRPLLDPSFERGADHPETIAALHDPPKTKWLREFASERIDGVLLVTGPDRAFVRARGNELLARLAGAVKVVYSEIGETRRGRERGREHFGFADGISQPRLRGLALSPPPMRAAGRALPQPDPVWPGEFVLGYPGQDPAGPEQPGPVLPLPAPWARNGSYMVLRRLEQRVPEFRRFVAAQAARLGIDAELLAARMVGRWRSGAPLLLAPLRDNPALGQDAARNNAFLYAADPWQRACPYAAHIRKVNERDEAPGGSAQSDTHRILRAGISFGPEVMPGETRTMHSRGLMFLCYQASIGRQFEFLQKSWASNPDAVGGKERPGGGPVTPGWDPIIGQAPGGGLRSMDEPAPNWPAGSRRSTLDMPDQFVVLTAAAYFFVPSLSALRTAMT